MKRHIANIITGIRILGSVCMLCFPVFSPPFYCIYLLCGFTDMIDGTVARKINSATSFGSRLDSVADLIFLTAASIKILPAIYIPGWLWLGILVIFIIKITAVTLRYIRTHHFMFKHTLLNKITGFLLFLLPLSLPFIEIKRSAGIVCTAAFFSAIQELKNVSYNDNP